MLIQNFDWVFDFVMFLTLSLEIPERESFSNHAWSGSFVIHFVHLITCRFLWYYAFRSIIRVFDCASDLWCIYWCWSRSRNANRLLIMPDLDSSLSTTYISPNGFLRFCIMRLSPIFWILIVQLIFDVFNAVDRDPGTRVVYWLSLIRIPRYPPL